MKVSTVRRAGVSAVAVLTVAGTVAACGDDDTSAGGSSSGTSGAGGAGGAATGATFGDACDQLPTGSAAGSLASMAGAPVVTASATNPLLGTFSDAVASIENLSGTLDTQEHLTVFAPSDSAFAALPKGRLAALVSAGKKQGTSSTLFRILAHHVLTENDDPQQAVGEKTTLEGDGVTVSGDPASGMTVMDSSGTATVVCGPILTANATVYVIDRVLTGTA